jgi:hypothetical protein
MPTPAPVIGGADSACENRVYTYSVTPTAGDSYSWSVSGGTILGSSTGSGIDVLWGTPGAGTVSITQTTPFGCDSTISFSPGIVIMPTPAPVIGGADSACENRVYTYSVTPTAGDIYIWSVSGVTILGYSTGSGIVVLWGTPGAGTVSITQTTPFGCDSTISFSPGIVIMPTPAPVIGGDFLSCDKRFYTFFV